MLETIWIQIIPRDNPTVPTEETTHVALALDVQQQQIEAHEVLALKVDPGQRYPQVVGDVLWLGAAKEQ